MITFENLLNELQSTHPSARVAIATEKQAELEDFSSYELDRIGLSLLAASSPEDKEEYPVIGEGSVKHGVYASEA